MHTIGRGRWARIVALVAMLVTLGASAAEAANPARPSFREGKADFADKELALTYAFGPGALDFALTDALSLGLSVDQVFGANDWYYRATYKMVDNPEAGLAIALNAGAIQTRERLAGDQFLPPVWGYQGGVLVSFLTDSGLTFRGGLQLYDTDWGAPGGQQVLFTPEIAYRFGLFELTLVPSWPLNVGNWNWVGVRLRI
jgi:hypothetical protein